MAAKEIKFKPEIVIEGESIKVEPNPHLLGVYLDCKMSFNTHVNKVVE